MWHSGKHIVRSHVKINAAGQAACDSKVVKHLLERSVAFIIFLSRDVIETKIYAFEDRVALQQCLKSFGALETARSR
jgi:hypothetical protein